MRNHIEWHLFSVLWRSAFVLSLALLSSGCGVPRAEHEAVLDGVQREIEALRVESEEAVGKLRAELEAERAKAGEERAKYEAEVERLSQEGEIAGKALEALKAEFEAYRKSYRVSVREKAKGMSIDELSTQSGKVFRGVTVRSVNETVVSFVHESGSGSMELAILDPRFQELLGYDPRDAELVSRAVDRDQREVVTGVGDVEKITDSWDQLVAAEAKRKGRIEGEILANEKKREAIVRQMEQINAEIVKLDNAIIRAGAKQSGALVPKKRNLEVRYNQLAAQLGRVE